MKNVLVVDGAVNCAYDIFSMKEDEFALIFTAEGQNVQFIEDLEDSYNVDIIRKILAKMWSNPVKKEKVEGIHGILFYQLQMKKQFYPNKMDEDLDFKGRRFSVRDL